MDLRNDKRQKARKTPDSSLAVPGEARETRRRETESFPAFNEDESPADTDRIMEEICEWENLKEAMWSKRGRDSARRSAFATAQQPRARRTRPGTGAPWTSLCEIRGRQQHLRSQRTSGSTGDEEHYAIHRAKA